MYIHEDFISLVVKERMEDAVRFVEQRRAVRAASLTRPPARVRLGLALVRLGRRIMRYPSPVPGSPSELRRVPS